MNTKFTIKEDNVINKDLIKHITENKLPDIERHLPSPKKVPTQFPGNKSKITKEVLEYKVIGNYHFSTDCVAAYESDPFFEEKDKELNHTLPSIIKEFNRRDKRCIDLNSEIEFKQRKQLLINSYKIKKHKREYHTLLDSIKFSPNQALSNESEEEEFFSTMERGRNGLIYPKYDNVINYWVISEPVPQTKIFLGHNILCRQNPFVEVSNHMRRYSLWKIKEIKKFFALLFMVPFSMDDLAAKLGKKTYCCKAFFDINAKPFELPQVMREAKKKQPQAKKAFIKEFLKDAADDLEKIFGGLFEENEVREPNFPKDEIIVSLEDYQRILNEYLRK